jgi:hypothetical protein
VIDYIQKPDFSSFLNYKKTTLETDNSFLMLKSQWQVENYERNRSAIAEEQLKLEQKNTLINEKKLQLTKESLDSQLRQELNSLIAEERALQQQEKYHKETKETVE